MDGVLIHSMTVANQIFFDAVEEELNLPTETFREDKKLMALSAEERFELLWSEEIQAQNISEQAVKKTLQLYRDRKLATDIPLLPHAKQVVELMAEHFEFLTVVSSNPKAVIDAILKRLGMESYFSSTFGIDHLQFTKPHPEIYQTAASHFGMEPKKCLAFEDSTHGIASAKGAGMQVIAVATGLESADDLKKTPADGVLKDFSELTMQRVEEFLNIIPPPNPPPILGGGSPGLHRGGVV